MARRWTSDVEAIYESMGELDAADRATLRDIDFSERELRDLFEQGWLDLDAETVDRANARDEFFDVMELLGYDREDFDWDAWREWMGYE